MASSSRSTPLAWRTGSYRPPPSSGRNDGHDARGERAARLLGSRCASGPECHRPTVRRTAGSRQIAPLFEPRNRERMDLVCVTVDSADPAAVAVFWSKALRWRDVIVAADGSGAVCRSPVGGPYLE